MDRRTILAILSSLALHGLLLAWPGPRLPPPDAPGRPPVSLRVLTPKAPGAGSDHAPAPAPFPDRKAAVGLVDPGRAAPSGPSKRRVTAPVDPSRRKPGPAPRPTPFPPLPADATDTPGRPSPGLAEGPGTSGGPGGSGEPGGPPGLDPGVPASPGVAPPEGIAGSASAPDPLHEARVRYAWKVRQALARSLASPVPLRRHGPSPDLAFRLRIREDGRVLEAIPDAPCQDEGFCREVREAALALGNLPSPPGGAMEIRVPVRVHPLRPR
ncbi:MAG TPA: hypothetical protein PLQ97_03835 [Myxococcota bacterium]|nr:hypothetical protein [Myxococcota bacterium]HQK50012.1 hypothetical protein [Myxococcota bacterium]